MAKLNTIVKYLDKELQVNKIKESRKNGLEFRAKKRDVKKIGFAVDGCMEAIKKAIALNCDMLVVHHGIKWIPDKYPTITKPRLAFLKKDNLSVYGVHLPLDAHHKYGNNRILCNLLGLNKIKKFGRYHGFYIGYSGQFAKAKPLGAVVRMINNKLKTKSLVLPFGKKKVKTVGIVSGGGVSGLPEAVKKKLDLFITGEIPHGTYQRSKEWKINVVAAGHYATETWGVRALMPLLEKKFGVKTVFIDFPTGI